MLGFEQQERRETKVGFGCSVSHKRNGRQGVCVPGGSSPPAKVTKMEATTPGVGWRWRRPPSRRQQRGNRAHASGTGGRERTEGERTGEQKAGRTAPGRRVKIPAHYSLYYYYFSLFSLLLRFDIFYAYYMLNI